MRFYNGKYTAQKSKEDWTGDEVSVEFEVINGRVEGKYRYQPGQYDGESCKFSGFIESNTKLRVNTYVLLRENLVIGVN